MEPIAIIGIGCRFPKAKDPESFWQLLRGGVDAISQVPKGRWDVDTFYDPKPGTPGKMNTRWGGFLEQVDRFDPNFFGISPREVERMDPQQRLVLEVGWEALENAGLAPQKLSGSQTGVFIGIGNYDYCRLLVKEDLACISAYDGTGNTLSIAANRLSYILNLRGPSVVIETACSSSLVALHFACRSLQSGESNLCLVGGVSLMLSPEPTINYSQARMMAADGRCKTFDASADGYVRGEGCGVVILKRLADAKRDEDNILAILKGSAVNQDGLSNGLTAPNGPSQQAVIRQALENAQIEPALVSYVEAHGTGTSLGDPIEFKSLKAVLMQGRKSEQPCWLGSVKTNIGHLEAAAGMASLIKVVLSLQHKEIPPHLHLKQVNPYISLEGTTFSIPTKCQAWLPGTERRYAGISAFGFGGTNCHVILEEAPSDFRLPILDFRLGKAGEESELLNSQEQINNPKSKTRPQDVSAAGRSPVPWRQNPKSIERPLQILTLSAKCEQALRELAQRYADFLATHPDTSLADVCFTANTGRSHFEFRLAVLAESSMQLQAALGAFAAGDPTQVLCDRVNSKKRPRIAFLFTGQGSQYVGMGRELYETQPTFRAAIDRCDRILRAYLEKPLLEVLYPSEGVQGGHKRAGGAQEAEGAGGEKLIQNPKSKIQNPKLIDETAYTQPALFALEYALVQLWKSWGIEPDAVMGHSVGEYVAACVAGVFSLEDGLKLIAERARLMQYLPHNGEMVAVFADENRVQTAIQPYAKELAIAAINGPQMSVISGDDRAMQAVTVILQAEGIKTKKLNVSHAFHSPLMERMLPAFGRVAADIAYSSPRVKLISNLTGELATDQIATPEYWCRHVRQTVKFAASMETLHRQGYEVFVEIGPKPTLLGMAGQFLPVTGFPSLQRGRSQWQQMLQSLAQLYMRGVSIDWSGFDRDYPRRRAVLPTYPFQRQRYWFETDNKSQKTESLQENVSSSIANLLQGDIQHLAQQLEQTGELSAAQVKLLPKLLALLKQHQQKAESIKDWFYNIEWQQRSRQVKATLENQVSVGSWLIFSDRTSVGQTLAGLLGEQGHNCILVYAANTYNLEAGVASLNPSNLGDFERLLREVTSDRPLQGVVHLWSLEKELTEELTIPTLERASLWSCCSVLHLVQALVKYNASTPPQLWLVTRGAVPVEPSLPAIAQAPVWGLGKVVALEHPELWGGMVDLAPQISSDEAQKLLAEIGDSQGEDHLAFRDGNRYVARLVQQRSQSQKLTFHSEGTYLITGGLGALGLVLAQWMVEQGARQLVLTGRSGASSQAQETITRIEQTGAKVIVAQADVSKEEDITRVLEEVKASMPPLRGVVHAAGVIDDGILLQQDWEKFTRVMNPKVKGAWNLHVLTQNLPLDFFILFSSAASMLGSPGQGNYAAANTFLDVLAHYRQALGLPGLSINWGPWSQSGMAAKLSNRDRDRLAAQGIKAIAPVQGMQVLQVLGSLAQVGVLPFDWSMFKQQLGSGHRSLLSELVSETNSVRETQSSPPQQLLRRLQEVAASDRQELLIAFIRDKVANVLGISSSQLDVEQSLQDLGFDSLMAVELRSFIQTELQVDLPVRAFIEEPSINNLAALLLDQLIPGSATNVVRTELDLDAEAVLDPAISPVNARIEQLTEPAAILLTGATGFLGAFLLHNLLEQTEANIYCLVRPSTESGKIRLQKNLESFELWNENFSSRIIPVEGDLSQPQLGLSTEQFEWMASEIDTIYHNGAFLSYVYPYSRLKSINVLGTQEILRLACLNKVKPVHHISSVAVFESSAFYSKQVTEANLHLPSKGIFLGYSQTKWVSEKLVAIAGDRGLPVCIYRPPLISGHSQTGVWNTDGFLCRMIKGCIQMGSMPDLDLILDLSPVDYVAQTVVYLSKQKESIGKAFHLQNPYPLHWRELVDFTSSSGYGIERLSYEDWQVQLKNKRENPLYPLLPFFIQKWTDEQLTYIELNQQDKRPQIGCQETLNALAGSSISCPALDSKLLDTYFSYLIRSGFLDAPINKF